MLLMTLLFCITGWTAAAISTSLIFAQMAKGANGQLMAGHHDVAQHDMELAA